MEKFSFFQDVYAVVNLIPKGRVTTYGLIARYLGLNKSARMVGWALNNATGLAIPAHRVVNRVGVLSGKNHFSTQNEMQLLLEQEGIQIVDDKIVDFKVLLWDPNLELIW